MGLAVEHRFDQAMLRAAGVSALIAVLLLAGFSCEAPDRADREDPPNILLILVDTLRADHLGYAGYGRNTSPNIDDLARENIMFENAIAPAPWTPPSVASIFTGLYPTAHGVHTRLYDENSLDPDGPPTRGEVLSDELPTLAEVLQVRGYHTMAIVTNPWITENLGFAQGFAHYWQANDLRASYVTSGARTLIEKARTANQPFFLYLHYMEPHFPYDPVAKFAGTFSGRMEGYESLNDVAADRFNRYDEEILSVDAAIGELVRYLKESGLYDDMVLLFVSDHGEQFFERGRRGHGYGVHAEEVRVPLIVRTAGRQGNVSTGVSLVDLYTTILHLAGEPSPPRSQGFSLLDGPDRRAGQGILAEMTHPLTDKAVVRPDGAKLILRFDADCTSTVTQETGSSVVGLYDTRADPVERTTLSDPELGAELEAAFWEIYAESVRRREDLGVTTTPLTEETIEKLRSLGYIQ